MGLKQDEIERNMNSEFKSNTVINQIEVTKPSIKDLLIQEIDFMDGHVFEEFCAELLRQNGYKYSEMFEFCKFMIRLRKQHPILRGRSGPSGCGFPEVSIHNQTAWNSSCSADTRTIGIMFAGRNADNTEDDIIYIGLNTFWEDVNIQLPNLPLGRKWRVIMNTEFQGHIRGKLITFGIFI